MYIYQTLQPFSTVLPFLKSVPLNPRYALTHPEPALDGGSGGDVVMETSALSQ